MELNRYPDNYFAEVEQAAFSPANVVPGIGFSPDKMLQARLFSYGDTQRYRLGVNFNHIPVNAPKCPFHSYHRDGAMRTDGNLRRRRPATIPTARACGSTTTRRSPSRRCRSKATAPLGPSRRRRPLGAARQPVPDDDPGAAAGALREHRPRDGRRPPRSEAAPYRQLRARRIRRTAQVSPRRSASPCSKRPSDPKPVRRSPPSAGRAFPKASRSCGPGDYKLPERSRARLQPRFDVRPRRWSPPYTQMDKLSTGQTSLVTPRQRFLRNLASKPQCRLLLGGRWWPGAERDIRGFALKF